jgi:hypothetical protein
MQPEKLNRRGFVRAAGAAVASLAIEPKISASPNAALVESKKAVTKSREPVSNLPREAGTYYEATVPQTLDLAERARLGINHFTSNISEKDDYEMHWRANFQESNPPVMRFQNSILMACQAKCMEVMALERLMSGSRQNLELEAKMLAMMVGTLGEEDGLHYVLPSAGRKPWLGPEEYRPYAHVHGQGRMMRAMLRWYQYTGDPAWKERVDRMVNGFDRRLVVHKDDYAYIPTGGWLTGEHMHSCYLKDRGWRDTEEPRDEKNGEEGSLFADQGHIPGALANWYVLTGNEQALRLSGQLVRFLTKPKFWADWKGGEYPGVVGAEHAHWRGHWLHMCALRSILEYADIVDDVRLKLFVREGYEWGRQQSLARLGIVGNMEGCACGRAIGLAIKLTDAGVGDYWEDVDLYIRNEGTERQFTPEDIPYLRKMGEGKPAPKKDTRLFEVGKLGQQEGVIDTGVGGEEVLKASMGAFAVQPDKTWWAECCSPWGNFGIAYAWEATLRYADGVARVNLLLNRASPWMDIDSYLPYEGKVVLRNKLAREALVRMPLWVDKKAVRCWVGDQVAPPEWFGNYLRFRGLKASEVVTIKFAVAERVERWTALTGGDYGLDLPEDTVYTCKFKGNTLVELSPPLVPGCWEYQDRAEKYKATQAPMTKVTRYVTPMVLKW